MAHELPKLPYALDALEPHIDAKTMEIHHGKHHAAYVANLNAALEGTGLEEKSVCEIICDLSAVPEDKRGAVRNNGGGHFNHSIFWDMLSADGGGTPSGDVAAAIDKSFGSFDNFKEEFKKAAMTRFGSGWAWLVTDMEGNVAVTSTPNQDNPMMGGAADCCGSLPLLGLDVWEHAYYVDYRNARPKYVESFWSLINWEFVAKNFQS